MHREWAKHRRPHLRLIFLILWMYAFNLTFVATFAAPSRLQAADESSQQELLSRLLGASGCLAWRPVNLHASSQGWCRRYWRSMASMNDEAAETSYMGDYSPTPNVDRGVGVPLPSPIHEHSMLGNKRKLLQDYSPMANTNNARSTARQ